MLRVLVFFFFKQKTAYEMRISDWSSDVCSSDLANLKRWEIWGSTTPDPEGSYDGWVKLLECEAVKPSGLPVGENSEEDIAHAQEGEYFTFPSDAPQVRYLRIKVLETWAGTAHSFTSQVNLSGSNWQGVQ